MSTIKYIGFYDYHNDSNERVSTLAGANKMDYIAEVIIKSGSKVIIVSPSWAISNIIDKNNLKSKDIIINNNKSIKLFRTIKTKSKWMKPFKVLLGLLNLFFWLIFNVRKNEKILVYHSPLLSFPLLAAKCIKKFSFVLEVEEIFSEVWEKNFILKKWEWKLVNAADSYICASDLLAERLGIAKSLVVYGSYSLPQLITHNKYKKNIDLIYAGSIDIVKGGAFNAIKSMKYLNSDYKLHICGFGTDVEIKTFTNLINKVNNSIGHNSCIYHGKLMGEKFSSLLSRCDIALNPQHVGDYMNSAFPSKISTYLSHNLQIVSTNIKSVQVSAYAPYINFTKSDSPKDIAEMILSINTNNKNNYRQLLVDLETDLIKEIEILFSINVNK